MGVRALESVLLLERIHFRIGHRSRWDGVHAPNIGRVAPLPRYGAPGSTERPGAFLVAKRAFRRRANLDTTLLRLPLNDRRPDDQRGGGDHGLVAANASLPRASRARRAGA